MAIHEHALVNLTRALQGSKTRFIQISAAGAEVAASSDFLRSKARGDQILRQSGLDWVVFRPTLVLGPQAYGGPALLRAAAAVPYVGVQVFADAPIQTVALSDVARAVVFAAQGRIARSTLADLTEPDSQSFAQLLVRMRQWLGYAPWRFMLVLTKPLLRGVALLADGAGWLGWRPALRSTALKVLQNGVAGEGETFENQGGFRCLSLDETLNNMPSTLQDRWFASLYLLLPISVLILALFWIGSGMVCLWQWCAAINLLMDRDVGGGLAGATVWIGGIIWAADLWVDPLGPLLKVLQGMVLALVVAALLGER